jgi:hypothetical protein
MRASTCAKFACSGPSYACVCAYRSRAQYEHKHAHELFLCRVSTPAHINSGRCTHAHACRSRANDRRAPRMRGRGRSRGRAAPPSPLSAWPCAGCGGWGGGGGGGRGPGRRGPLARQTRGETGSARRRRRRAADAGGGRVEEGAVAWAKAVGRRRARGDGGAAARADGKISQKSNFLVTSYSTFTRALTFQNFGPGRGGARAARSGRGQARC